MKLSDGERSATIAPVQEAGRILLDAALKRKHRTYPGKEPFYKRT
jgi:hypothetical protein